MEIKEIIQSCAGVIRDSDDSMKLVIVTPAGIIEGKPLFCDSPFESSADKVVSVGLSRLSKTWIDTNNPSRLCGDDCVFILYDVGVWEINDDEERKQLFSADNLVVRYDSVIACTVGAF